MSDGDFHEIIKMGRHEAVSFPKDKLYLLDLLEIECGRDYGAKSKIFVKALELYFSQRDNQSKVSMENNSKSPIKCIAEDANNAQYLTLSNWVTDLDCWKQRQEYQDSMSVEEQHKFYTAVFERWRKVWQQRMVPMPTFKVGEKNDGQEPKPTASKTKARNFPTRQEYEGLGVSFEQ